jgi:hypothetical protein
LTKSALPPLNKALHEGGLEPLDVRAAVAFDEADEPSGSGSAGAGANRGDADTRGGFDLPRNLRLWN